MAVDAASYGATTGVERRVGDLLTARALTSSTIPSLSQVELIIDDVAADLNTALQAAGYSVPVSTGDPYAHRWLQAVNEDGAAAAVLATMPVTAIRVSMDDAGNRANYYYQRFQDGLKRIDEGKLRITRTQTRLHGVASGAATDSDGNTKLPIFTRGMGRYPGTVSMTE